MVARDDNVVAKRFQPRAGLQLFLGGRTAIGSAEQTVYPGEAGMRYAALKDGRALGYPNGAVEDWREAPDEVL